MLTLCNDKLFMLTNILITRNLSLYYNIIRNDLYSSLNTNTNTIQYQSYTFLSSDYQYNCQCRLHHSITRVKEIIDNNNIII